MVSTRPVHTGTLPHVAEHAQAGKSSEDEARKRLSQAQPPALDREASPLALTPGAPMTLPPLWAFTAPAHSTNRTARQTSVAGLQDALGNAHVSRAIASQWRGRLDPAAENDEPTERAVEGRSGAEAAYGVPLAVAASRPAPIVLRYQAGERGHGGIEQRALTTVGFSAGEARGVYLGNWLRDLSQLPKHPAVLLLIRILAMGEFGHDVSAADLGSYVPSEHLDNPEGGGTVEDPLLRDPATGLPKDPAAFQALLDGLSPAQRAAYDREEANRTEIAKAARTSHLPEYIERGKFHAKEQLRQAVIDGRTPTGMREMGDALHAVEDYFSHSNFVEACIFMLKSDPAVKPLVTRMAETHLGPNPALLTPVDPKTGEVQIQTGTYAPGANDWVSRIELLQTEIENGELRTAFAIGWMEMAGITGEEIGRRLGAAGGEGTGTVLGAVGGGVAGGAEGAATGAASGALAGYSRGSGFWDTIASTAEGLAEGAVTGGVAGAASGAVSGARSGGALGGALGGAAGAFAGRSLAEVVAMVGLDLVLTVVSVPFAAATVAAKAGILEKLAELETNASGGEARARGLTPGTPTHSELAKDAPDNRLFGVSVKLAETADREIGTAMIAAWSATTAGSPTAGTSPEADAVVKMVDKFVCHPAQDAWWQPVVRAEAAALATGP